MNEPRRGEVWMVDLGMAAKVRPCLVISIGAADQDRALTTVVPHTTSARNSRFEVNVKVGFLRDGVFDVQSLVTIPHANLIRKIGTLAIAQPARVEVAVAKWLGLELQQNNKTGLTKA
jgi:mRNA interferase MazF